MNYIMYLLIWPCMSSKVYLSNASCPSFLTCLHCSLGLVLSSMVLVFCYTFPVPRSSFAIFWKTQWPCHYCILCVCTLSITLLVPRLILPWETDHSIIRYQVPLKHGHNSLLILELLKKMDEILGNAGHLTEELILGSILNELLYSAS